MKRRRNPTLGILPLLIGAGLIGSGVWLKLRQFEDYEDWKDTVPPPVPPPAPAAPQTEDEMRAWTPDKEHAAYLDKWEEWRRRAIPGGPPDPAGANDLLWAAVGLGTVSALMLWRS